MPAGATPAALAGEDPALTRHREQRAAQQQQQPFSQYNPQYGGMGGGSQARAGGGAGGGDALDSAASFLKSGASAANARRREIQASDTFQAAQAGVTQAASSAWGWASALTSKVASRVQEVVAESGGGAPQGGAFGEVIDRLRPDSSPATQYGGMGSSDFAPAPAPAPAAARTEQPAADTWGQWGGVASAAPSPVDSWGDANGSFDDWLDK